MMQFRLKTAIQLYDTATEFCKNFQIGSEDLILTRKETYERYFKENTGKATVVDFRTYGTGEPTDQMVEAIHKDIEGITYKRVIAIGGGSILDVAKLFVLRERLPVQDLFERKLEFVKEKELIAIPTTCGTGSEVTNISVLTLTDRNTKLGLSTEELYADHAILIPELLDTLPYQSFATSSIDAFVHALEAYLSPKASDFTRLYSMEALKLILNGYQKVAAEGEQARLTVIKDFLLASTYAGIAFGNAGVAAVHALSYPLSGAFHVPHGEANYAILWGVLWRYNTMQSDGRLRQLNLYMSDILGCKEERLYQELHELFQSILPRKSLSDYGVTSSQLEEFTTSVLQNQRRLLVNNYVELNKEDIYEIYCYLYQ